MTKNQVTLIGYVGNHLSCQKLANGNKRLSIRIATHCKSRDKLGTLLYHTVWHDVLCWNAVADYAQRNFVKGSKVLVDGSISYRTYPDRTGHIRYITQIKAHSLMNLDR